MIPPLSLISIFKVYYFHVTSLILLACNLRIILSRSSDLSHFAYSQGFAPLRPPSSTSYPTAWLLQQVSTVASASHFGSSSTRCTNVQQVNDYFTSNQTNNSYVLMGKKLFPMFLRHLKNILSKFRYIYSPGTLFDHLKLSRDFKMATVSFFLFLHEY